MEIMQVELSTTEEILEIEDDIHWLVFLSSACGVAINVLGRKVKLELTQLLLCLSQ